MHNGFTPYDVRVGDSWTRIAYDAESAKEWMKPLVRGRETNLIEIPASWYFGDLPSRMFIKSSRNSHGLVSPHNVELLWRDQFDWVYREMDYAVFPITSSPMTAWSSPSWKSSPATSPSVAPVRTPDGPDPE